MEEEAERERKKSEARFSIPGSHTPLRLADLKLIQLRRDRLERIYEEPYFTQIVKGMVVRVTIGQDTKRNAPKYLVGEIVGTNNTPTHTHALHSPTSDLCTDSPAGVLWWFVRANRGG